MLHSGSPSLHTTLKDSSDVGSVTLGAKGSSGFPDPRGCNVVTSILPITATSAPENTLAHLTILMVTVRTTAPQPGMEILPDQQSAYQGA
jgi:hypothetical protein